MKSQMSINKLVFANVLSVLFIIVFLISNAYAEKIPQSADNNKLLQLRKENDHNPYKSLSKSKEIIDKNIRLALSE